MIRSTIAGAKATSKETVAVVTTVEKVSMPEARVADTVVGGAAGVAAAVAVEATVTVASAMVATAMVATAGTATLPEALLEGFRPSA